ncbi:protein serine/threonine kinase, putative [Entamoeba invadens IP1]|uniref:Protein serine/threonine kinase, putative n=1 Tax=Entamoeba invadens IP1 TaxID=370355 RepID=A0A0A1UG38_ENTIV|nr:protein serine/threonine kinase, putative [Entamoeba invadens IP1]ELP92314.1 protein serine/threonine kinase, putative [Entamoeba invadens IP1]|eukprot:XP_004259085.1 protein serine/threonine kinase, putative [Entamoeba invadens IP1]
MICCTLLTFFFALSYSLYWCQSGEDKVECFSKVQYQCTSDNFFFENNTLFVSKVTHPTIKCNLVENFKVSVSDDVMSLNGCSLCSPGYQIVRCNTTDFYCSRESDSFRSTCSIICDSYNSLVLSDSSFNCCGTNCVTESCVLSSYKFSTCSSCKSNYHMNSNICVPTCYSGNCKYCSPTNPNTCLECYIGFFLEGTSCNTCSAMSNCMQCDHFVKNCTQCSTNYYLSKFSDHYECTMCHYACKVCSNYIGCTQCLAGYYLNAGQCVQCDWSCGGACADVTGICTNCSSNLVFSNPKSKSCIQCRDFDNNCGQCYPNGERKCYECQSAFYPTTNGKCTSCDQSCAYGKCNSVTGICSECASGYTKNISDSISCVSCTDFDDKCEVCSTSIRKCNQCTSGLFPSTLSPFKCVECDKTCLGMCDSTTSHCYSCVDEYVLRLKNSTTCELCQNFDQNCLQCDVNGNRKCVQCETNYYVDTNGRCSSCGEHCSKCGSLTGECIECDENYIYSETDNRMCELCNTFDTNCISCSRNSSRICENCIKGMYPETSSGKCVNCGINCFDCNTTNGICLICESGFTLKKPKNLECELCVHFDENCDVCSTSERKCIVCKTGFYPDSNGVCFRCDLNLNCLECDSKNGTCTKCVTNTIFTTPKGPNCVNCNTIMSHCVKCSSDFTEKCVECDDGFYPNKSGTCIECDYTCDNKCESTTGVCKSCQSNFVFTKIESTKCDNCSLFDTNCVLCSTSFDRKCIECQEGKYPKLNKNETTCSDCDSTCNSKCDTRNGYCTGCQTNYVLYEISSLKCQSCSSFDLNCLNCSLDYTRNCVVCKPGYYVVNGKCKPCDLTCGGSCDTNTGFCTSCATNKVFSLTNKSICIDCNQLDQNCVTCAANGIRQCVTCTNGKYANSEGQCADCSSECGELCDGTTGKCTACTYNKVLKNNDSGECEECTEFDLNCITCATDASRNCILCNTGYYPVNNNNTKKCQMCDITCGGYCNTENGICTGCLENYIFISNTSKTCQSCNSFDKNCNTCSPLFEKKCVKCGIGYYVEENGSCSQCFSINGNCLKCSQTEKKCQQCKDPFHINLEGKCVECDEGEYKISEYECSNCFKSVPNCKKCTSLSVGKTRCVECFEPYTTDDNGNCVSCGESKYYNNKTLNCEQNNVTCFRQISKEKCLKCNENNFLSDGVCIKTTQCDNFSNITTTSCDCYNQLSINSDCQSIGSNCKYQKVVKSLSICVNCNDNFTNVNGNCISNKNNQELIRNGNIFQCYNNMNVGYNNSCVKCNEYNEVCVTNNNIENALKCKYEAIYGTVNSKCSLDENCELVKSGFCNKCKSTNKELVKGKCSGCKTTNCENCEGGKCKRCSVGYLYYKENWCISSNNVKCTKANRIGCVVCSEGYYQTDAKNVEDKYDYCVPIESTTVTNCKRYSAKNNKCVECLDAFKLKGGICAETFDEDDKLKTNTKTATETSCQIRNNKGCQHCADGYYNINNECVQCQNDCLTCYNTTYCTSCKDGFYLSADMTCKSLGALQESCNIALPGGGGCAICNSGYYREGISCTQCDESCALCVNSYECLACKDGYFNIPSEGKLCESNTTLTNCGLSSSSGCERCVSGHFLSNYKCYECSSNCTSCESESVCTICNEREYVLVDSQCLYFTKVEFCVSALNSKCVKCEGNHKASDDGDSCVDSVKLGVVIGIPISVLILIKIVVSTIIVTIIILILHNKEEEKYHNICVFKMSRSNIAMISINKVLCCNKTTICFNTEEDDYIPVDEESRDLICIGNKSKHHLKVQFSVIEGCDCYEIRTVPSIVTLKKGEACEFEIFIKPLCSCKIKENVLVIGLDLVNDIQYTEKLNIETTTVQSTKLNYRELEEDIKIGEGSFGIVYKGIYRGSEVAIKKLKSLNATKEAVEEFENEVTMLDKFRSEFIIHFYGACFIPEHICMVTEFALYGSLRDLMKHQKSNEIRLKIKMKIIIDTSKGILYLHENGILHRDIKPDNILVVSLENEMNVNGKLTDFGSSRNINLLTTNMTFTKGIGTPVYMSEEVLKKEKYKKPADIYSLAITMYEMFIWGDIFPKNEFKFAWIIADFVSSGKRKEKPIDMDQQLFELIQKTWASKPEDRPTIDKVIDDLQKYYIIC